MQRLPLALSPFVRALPLVLASAFVLAGSGCRARPTKTESATAKARRFDFRYEVTIPAPADCAQLEVWVPLPPHDPMVQHVEVLEPRTSAGRLEVTHDPVDGNRMLYVAVPAPSEAVTISWSARVERFADAGQGQGPLHARHLEANALIPIDGKAQSMAIDLGACEASLATEVRARRIFDDVLTSMEYDKNHVGWGRGSFEHATTVCKGNCTDFHSRFIGVARAAGIPVRFTMGIPLGDAPSGSYDSYHCWAHYRDGDAWIPVDISEADKVAATNAERAAWFFGHLDPHRLTLSHGRDVALVPPCAAGPRNYFVFPHAEADGRELALDKSMWRFTWRDVDRAD